MRAPEARRRRHRTILELVRKQAIENQHALRRALADHGHRVTQSTLSRDLKELRIARVPEEDGYRYVRATEEAGASEPEVLALESVLATEVIGVENNEVTVVLRTRIGRAQGVAVYLDRHRPEGVLATIAGDDTVLIVPESIHEIQALTQRLADLFTEGSGSGPQI